MTTLTLQIIILGVFLLGIIIFTIISYPKLRDIFKEIREDS